MIFSLLGVDDAAENSNFLDAVVSLEQDGTLAGSGSDVATLTFFPDLAVLVNWLPKNLRGLGLSFLTRRGDGDGKGVENVNSRRGWLRDVA